MDNKIVLVTRQTRLDELVARFNTLAQARFYVEHLGADFDDYLCEHETYQRSIAAARVWLARVARVQVLQRSFLPSFIFAPEDIVVVLGQDGLVANTLKYLDGQPVVGVNPDPRRWDGVLLPFTVPDLRHVMREVLAGRRRHREVTMAQATLNDGQRLFGVNDLFIGPRSHVSARYELRVGRRAEHQSSSGIIVSTGLGATGWLKSILRGALGIAGAVTGEKLEHRSPLDFPWEARHLYYSVREPFPSRTSSAELVFGKITAGQPLQIVSEMPENGVIFSDGIEADYLAFNAGTLATVAVAERRGRLVL